MDAPMIDGASADDTSEADDDSAMVIGDTVMDESPSDQSSDVERDFSQLTYPGLPEMFFFVSELECPLDNGRHERPITKQTKMPFELWHMAFDHLSIQELIDLRSVSRGVRLAVDALPAYQAIVTHIPEVLRAVLTSGLASHMSCAKIYQALVSPACALCGNPGAVLYLLPCSRVCLQCLFTAHERWPISRACATMTYGLNTRAISALPSMTIFHRKLPRASRSLRVHVVDSDMAYQAGLSIHGSHQAMIDFTARRRTKLLSRYEQKLALHSADPENHRKPSRRPSLYTHTALDRGRHHLLPIDRCELLKMVRTRLKSTVYFPWLDRRDDGDVLEKWCICGRCQQRFEGPAPDDADYENWGIASRTTYTRAKLIGHYEECRKMAVSKSGL
ncbi:MAG: hypothetical protein M1819_002564 [Sarea resinae]|nr:MAG: hypothetical protein M1819_002564 [Sarea resinae]